MLSLGNLVSSVSTKYLYVSLESFWFISSGQLVDASKLSQCFENDYVMQLELNFLVIATRGETKKWWTNGGLLAVLRKDCQYVMAEDNSRANVPLLFCRGDQKKIMQC